ncbi:hypothetical protein NS234_07470 [Microbacterium oxydans]|uniref:hypothetical protein n=1 Tax=Microbacterium oxydans TaxID=82380 RepID=UPI000733DE89|nr:hypothetical protein [Microbacterium oxydans]KTR77436.1 hypothetical protein NS234_07470 [Microbacterium oxydans]
MSNNNEYLKIKIAQLEARKAAIEEELIGLDERLEAYTDQFVDEPEADEIVTDDLDGKPVIIDGVRSEDTKDSDPTKLV